MANIKNTTISRRAVLAGIAASAGVAAPAISRAAEPEVDELLGVWRTWRNLEIELRSNGEKLNMIWASLPNWARSPFVLIYDGESNVSRIAASESEIDRICARALPAEAAHEMRERALHEFREANAAADRERDRSGWAARQRRGDEITDDQARLSQLIENNTLATPAATAARLDLALASFDSDEQLEDAPAIYLVSAVRALLPQLPSEMRDALSFVAAGVGTVAESYLRPKEA